MHTTRESSKRIFFAAVRALPFAGTAWGSSKRRGGLVRRGGRVKRHIMLVFVVLVGLAPSAAGGASTETDGGMSTSTVDTELALVQLKGDPLSTHATTKPLPGRKIDFDSNSVKSYRAKLAAVRNDLKKWLMQNAPEAKVTSEFDITLNAVGVELNGAALERIAAAPMVQRAEHQAVVELVGHGDPDLALVQAFEAWHAAGGTPSAKGDGVRVAIIDSGIDVTHPCFDDAGYVDVPKDGPPGLTNNKVIVAKVFAVVTRGRTPEDRVGHGTSVAATVACNEHTTAAVGAVSIPYAVSGVAPRALLGNYNIIGARSEDLVNALEEAIEDGMDVANMSLGWPQSGIQDLTSISVDNADRAGMVVSVAAGNSGPGTSTVLSPGRASRALTAGASSVGHFIATPVRSGPLTKPAVVGEFPTVGSDRTAPLGVVLPPVGHAGAASPSGLSDACNPLSTASLSGRVALISRGQCSFSTKIRNAQDAGAIAALVVNNVGGDPFAMRPGGIVNEPTIPAYMVSLADGMELIPNDGAAVTISASKAYFETANSNLVAGFSSVGPTDVDLRIKPDVVAPGVNVLTARPASRCSAPPCWAFTNGTSFAAPHLAGVAAVVRGQHPTWSPTEVRSAIVNTADQDVLKTSSGGALATNVQLIGAGRANALSATNANVALDPVSVSFGAVPSGSGQSHSRTVTLTALSGPTAAAATVTSPSGPPGVKWEASLRGDTINVAMSADKGIVNGGRQAILRVWDVDGNEIAHAALYVLIT